jgi:ABC-2 type transport system permease protein
MRGLWKLTWMELKLFVRNPTGAFFTVIFPLMLLSVYGIMYSNELGGISDEYGLIDVSVPAFTGMVIAIAALTILNTEVATSREKGVLRRLKATPLRPLTILTAKLIMIFLMTCLGMVLMIVAGKLAFGLRFYGNLLNVVGGFLLSSFSFFAFGLVLASLMPNVRSAESVGFILLFVMLFFSGVFVPFEVIPEAVQQYAQVLPLTHVNTLLRGLWLGHGWGEHLKEVAVLAGILVAGVIISAKTFRWE